MSTKCYTIIITDMLSATMHGDKVGTAVHSHIWILLALSMTLHDKFRFSFFLRMLGRKTKLTVCSTILTTLNFLE